MTDAAARAVAVAAALVAVALATAYLALYAANPSPAVAGWSRALFLAVGLLDAAVGIAAARRVPYARVGALLATAGVLWLAYGLQRSTVAAVATLGAIAADMWHPFVAHAFLAFPDGRLRDRASRVVVTLAYTLAAAAKLWSLAFEDPQPCLGACPLSLVGLRGVDTATDLAALGGQVTDAVGLLVAASFAAVLVRRYRGASRSARRALAPLLVGGLVFAVAFVLDAWDVAVAPPNVLPAAVAVAVAWALVRDAADRARVSGLAVAAAAGPDALTAALRVGLHDPGLVLWRLRDGQWVDDRGRVRTGPDDGTATRTTMTELVSDGRTLGALQHDPALLDRPDLVEPVRALAVLALEREELASTLQQQLRSTQEAQRRLVHVQDETRRRLERDLHDGAQQALLGVVLSVQRAATSFDRTGSDDVVRDALTKALTTAEAALGELRLLARGVHPAVLNEAGLTAALRALAQRAGYPVEVGETPIGRYPPEIELTAYFVTAEALTNAARHGKASAAWIDAWVRGPALVVRVRDDGSGGAAIGAAGGLRNLADRVQALDGTLEVASTPTDGTTVIACLPVDPQEAAPCES